MTAVALGACARCRCPIEAGDLRCAVCGQSTPASLHPRDQIHVQVLRCDGCGAAVKYDVEAQAPRCAFCSSVMHVEGVSDPMEQTGWFVSFALEPDAARVALKRWLGSLGWFRPSDLKSAAAVESLQPLWWAGWVFDGQARVSWTADSNAGSGRAAWAPHAGQFHTVFQRVLVPASRGLTEAETDGLTVSYDMARGAPQPIGPENATIEQFDIQRSSARERIAQAATANATREAVETYVPGSRHRNVHVEALLEALRTHRCAFPAYVLAYRYRGSLYRAVVSGQSEAHVLGQAPYSIAKIVGVVGAVVLLIVAVAMLASL
jgi:hypothetical protein